MPLTDARLRTLTKPGKHFDGAGLYLPLTAAGGRYWRLKYRHGGKEKRLALRVYRTVSLKAARDATAEARKLIAAGADPGALRKTAKAQTAHENANTLDAVAHAWLSHQSGCWAPVTADRVRASLEGHILPVLGARPLSSIRPSELMAAIKAVQARSATDQASRVLQRVKAFYRWAVTHERIESHPIPSHA